MAALLPLAGSSCCTLSQAVPSPEKADAAASHAAEAPRSYVQACMEKDYPALLLKAVNSDKHPILRHPDTADLDPTFTILCCVLCSHKLEPRPGDFVLLRVPSGRCGDESGPAERTRYWFVSGKEGEDWMPERWRRGKPSGYHYVVNALDFHGFDAEWLLLPEREKLHGVWRDMADMVANKEPSPKG